MKTEYKIIISIYASLFTTANIGGILWLLGQGTNLLEAVGLSLIVTGILFSVIITMIFAAMTSPQNLE